MVIRILVTLVLAGAGAIAASALMNWSSQRSAIWNMVFGVVVAVAVIAGVILIAILLANVAYPH